MISEMAKTDLKALRADGVRVSDEQVVTLHQLGMLVERGPFSGVVYTAPRVGWAGTVPVYEPTLQSERWYVSKAREWWCGESLFWALAWSCCHATKRGWFAKWTVEPATRTAIEQWGSELLCTLAQLRSALDFAIQGGDVAPDVPDSPAVAPEAAGACPFTDLINDALAAGLGLTVNDLNVMPRRRIVDILRRWMSVEAARAGGAADFDKGAKTDAYVKYDDFLNSIRFGRCGGAQLYG